MQNRKGIGTPGNPGYVSSLDRDDWFVCDKCGRKYSFTGSWMSVNKGDVYCSPLTNNQQEVASMDLCRDCSGMTAKLEQNGIDEAIINAGCAMEEKGINSNAVLGRLTGFEKRRHESRKIDIGRALPLSK